MFGAVTTGRSTLVTDIARTVKLEFALERARVHTFRRLDNIFALCILAYVFTTDFLRKAKGFKKVLKHLSDNLDAVSMKTHALLSAAQKISLSRCLQGAGTISG